MLTLLQNIYSGAILAMVLCTFLFYRLLKKHKKERELTKFESIMYVIAHLAIFLWATSGLILVLDKQ